MKKYNSSRIPKTDRITKLVEHLYAKMPEIESARAVLVTESYRQTEDQPMILRRARAFEHILKNIPIIIRENELIVGSSTIAPRGCQTFPEFSYEWLEAEFDTVATREADPFYISEQTKKELKEQHIMEKGKVMTGNFNKSYFTKIDIRVDKEIKLYSRSAKMLTSHPSSSYTLQRDANKQYVLRITDPQLFWSTSKYLVILVD